MTSNRKSCEGAGARDHVAGSRQKEPPMLSIRQAAAFFCVSEKTVRRWIACGDLGAHQVGRQWRISRKEIERYLATRSSWHRHGVL